MNNVSIEFVIGIGNNKIAITQDEAKVLYGQLKTLFGDRTPLPYTPGVKDIKAGSEDNAPATVIDITDKQYVEDPYANLKEEVKVIEKTKKNINSLKDKIDARLKEQQKHIQGDRLDESNKRVELARERAAARTAGCGSRKAC